MGRADNRKSMKMRRRIAQKKAKERRKRQKADKGVAAKSD